jgi:hypothetical protein
MAGTIVLGQFADGAVSFELDYDDGMNAIALRCSNTTEQDGFALVKGMGEDGNPTGIQFGLDGLPGQNSIMAIQKGKIMLSLPTGIGLGGKRFGGYLVDLRYPM